ncbi:MAG TPA: hypothetical protein VIH52_00125 [Candidatus Nanoarchaeia archaeon]|nr:hypothetical protein [uncultured archaeon]
MRQADKNQTGQTIIEIITAVAIGTVLILALVALSVRSNRGADFSKVESQAAKLASEGLEIIRNLKAANGSGVYYAPVCGSASPTNYTWSSLFSINSSGPDGGGLDEGCSSANGGGPLGKAAYLREDLSTCLAGQPKCLYIATNNFEAVTIDKRIFQRQIYIADSPLPAGKSRCNTVSTDWNKIKQLAVVVSWTDTAGYHESITTTCLQRN